MSSNFEKSTFEYNIKNELEDQWSLLKAKQNNEKIKEEVMSTYTEEPLNSFLSKDYYLVLDNENNKSIYLNHEGKKFKEDKKSANLTITMSVTNPRQEINNYIVLTCHNNENSNFISNLFNNLIAIILSKIKFENKSNLDSVKEAVQEYRDFFRGNNIKKLTAEEIRGLIAELSTLKKLLSHNNDIFDSWHGPDSERHDFRRNNISIEVKSTSSKNKICKVSDIDQLDKPVDVKLYCDYYQFEKDDQGLSIPSLIKDIKDMGVSDREFENKLNDLGYDIAETKYYDEPTRKFRIINNNQFIVDSQFPKITYESFKDNKIPIGVSKLNYQINLEGIPNLTTDQVGEYIKTFIQ